MKIPGPPFKMILHQWNEDDGKMNEKQHLGTNHSRKAGLLSIIPGIGQIYNKQLSKGVIFLVVFGLFIAFSAVYGIQAVTGLITLGTEAGRDHSMFMMVEGTLSIILYAIFLIGYAINIYDAISVGRMRDLKIKTAVTFKEIMGNVWENGFPYLLTMPAYILMAFVIIFPVLVTIFMAFTNYDLYHTPPANLIDWVGFKNFFSLFTQASWRETFFSILSWTFIWTICSSIFSIVLGITVAIVSNQSFIKGKRFFRIIFLLPWAVPAFITIMTFSNMFNDSIGAMNTQVIPFFNNFLPFLDLASIPWKTDPFWTKVAVIMIQTWLG
ncbi:sugar ABC transporter permease, partial [Eubacterium aggregans]|uniref:carbohydrate ABC transporter permease n=1 Tax=Eubacterium aggregans TaxID=81409 RepID=UPI003F405102